MRHNRQLIATLITLLLATTLTACAQTGPVEIRGAGHKAGPAAGAANLADTEWVLISLNDSPLIGGTHITLNFGGRELDGFAGCNAYGGKYTAAKGGPLTIHEMAVTLQLCRTPAGVMEQEKAYVDALTNAAAYRVTDGRLEIRNAAGDTTLVFRRKPEYPMNPADLVGTAWQLVSLAGDPLIEGSTITLAFHNDHVVSGHARCRDYVFAYQASGDGIRFPFQTMVGAPCLEDETLMRQEDRYTEALGWATDYRVGEGRLEVFTARGEVLTFEPLPADANADLEGTLWWLQAFVEEERVEGMEVPLPRVTELLKGTGITAVFADGVVSGSAGCNRYNGRYQRDGRRLVIADLAWEEKACAAPAGVMAQEQRYLDFLADVAGYRIIGRQLWLGTDDGRALVFRTARE